MANSSVTMDIDNVNSTHEYTYKYLVSPISTHTNDQFLSSPCQLGIALKSSVFSDVLMAPPIFHKGKGTMIISTKNPLSCALDSIKLGTWKVNCSLISNTRPIITYGVIGPISLTEDLSVIKSDLLDAEYPVLDVYRIHKKVSGKQIPTQCIKIGFSVKTLPTKLVIWQVPFYVRQYIPNAKQCFKCQRFGHVASSCKSKERCLFCSAAHEFKVCPKDNKKCANCKGPHLANYGGCEVFKRAQRIERLATEAGVQYSVIIDDLKGNTRPTSHNVYPQNNSYVSSKPPVNNILSNPLLKSYASAARNFNSRLPQSGPHAGLGSIPSHNVDPSLTSALSQMANSIQSVLTVMADLLKSFQTLFSSSPAASMVSTAIDSLNSIPPCTFSSNPTSANISKCTAEIHQPPSSVFSSFQTGPSELGLGQVINKHSTHNRTDSQSLTSDLLYQSKARPNELGKTAKKSQTLGSKRKSNSNLSASLTDLSNPHKKLQNPQNHS